MAWTILSMAAEIVRSEGGLVNNPHDPGGITNFGISLRFAKLHPDFFDLNDDGVVDAADIRLLTPALAQSAYIKFFYEVARLDQLPAGASNIVMQLFDLAVNTGPMQAIKILQHALGCSADGTIGPATLAAFHTACDTEGVVTVNNLVVDARIHFYEQVVAAHPDSEVFFAGWKNRANKYRV